MLYGIFMTYKRFYLACIFLIISSFGQISAQQIQAARNLFNEVAERYGNLTDYSADISITSDDPQNPGKTITMEGKLSWKRRSRLRIDFSRPSEQVIVSDGLTLQIYMKDYNVTLVQRLNNTNNPANLATAEGLSMLRRGYNIAYKTSPGLNPIDPKNPNSEKVYQFLLRWRDSAQGFREIDMAVSESKFIRRIEGLTADNRRIVLQFSNLAINQNLPDTIFNYTPPPGSNRYDNFLFGSEN
jgi:outer membrane lipoprotein-sorting protein